MWKQFPSLLFVLILLLFLFKPINLQSELVSNFKEIPPKATEWFFEFRYEYFSWNFIIYEIDEKWYIPTKDLFDILKIYYEFDEKTQKLSGYYNSKDTNFTVLFVEKQFKTFQKEDTLSSKDLYTNELNFYFSEHLLENLFVFDIELDKSKLVAKIKSPTPLPLLRDVQRELQAKKLVSNRDELEWGPMISDREFVWLSGGVLNYSIYTNQSNQSQNLSTSTRLGLELLGGNFQLFSSIYYDYKRKNFDYRNNYAWNYSMPQSKWLTQVNLGDLSNTYLGNTGSGLNIIQGGMKGISVSNFDYKQTSYFTEYIIENAIQPNSTIELFSNEQFVKSVSTDPSGYFRLGIPINYGNTRLKLKIYGPFGEFREIENFIYIPGELLPPLEPKYTILYGFNEYTKETQLSGMLNTGLTNWLTLRSAYFKTLNKDTSNYFIGIATKLIGSLTGSLDYVPNGILRSALKLYSEKYGYYELNLDKNMTQQGTKGRDYTLSTGGNISSLLSLPFPLASRVSLDFGKELIAGRLNTYTALNLLGLRLSFNHTLIYSRITDVGKSYAQALGINGGFYFRSNKGFWDFLSSTSVSFGSTYDIDNQIFRNIMTNLSFNIINSLNVGISFNTDLITKNNSGSINISLTPEYFRLSSTGSISKENYSVSSNIQGNAAFNPSELLITFSSTSSYLTQMPVSAKLRFYLDENQNGKFDEKTEIIIPNVKVKVFGGTSLINSSSSSTDLNALLPNTQYNVEIDRTSIKNPIWFPSVINFSFVSSSGSMKIIDIPFYPVGVITGLVTKTDKKGSRGQSSVKIIVRNIENDSKYEIPVFGDGSFYFIGIKPGKYFCYVDSMQVSLLDCVSFPMKIDFEIKADRDGDYVENLDFELVHIAMTDRIATLTKKSAKIGDLVPPIDTTLKPSLEVSPEEQAILNLIEKQNNEIATIETPAKSTITIQYNKPRDVGLTKNNQTELGKLVKKALLNPRSRVLIESHSDNFGTISENFEITQKRAEEVSKYLIKQGLRAEQIISHPKGSLSPIDNNRTEEGRKRNRRTVVKIIEK